MCSHLLYVRTFILQTQIWLAQYNQTQQTNKQTKKQTNEQTNTTMSSKTIFSSTWLDITSLSVKVGNKKKKKEKKSLIICFCSQKWFKKKFKMEYERVPHKNFAKAVNIFLSFKNNKYSIHWASFNGITDSGDQLVNGIKLISFDKSQITISYLMYVKFICLLVSIGNWNQFLSVPRWSY